MNVGKASRINLVKRHPNFKVCQHVKTLNCPPSKLKKKTLF